MFRPFLPVRRTQNYQLKLVGTEVFYTFLRVNNYLVVSMLSEAYFNAS